MSRYAGLDASSANAQAAEAGPEYFRSGTDAEPVCIETISGEEETEIKRRTGKTATAGPRKLVDVR